MNKKTLGIFVSLLVVAMLALPTFTVFATKSMIVEGNRVVAGIPIAERREAGNNIIHHTVAPHMWTGDIEGLCSSEAMRVYHNYRDGHLWVNVHAVDTFSSATVMDKTGGLTIRLDFKKDMVAGTVKGTWVIISGTGELENLRGQGKFEPDGGISGMVHLDP